MSPAKKKNYSDPTLEELLRDMPDDSLAVQDYGAMQNEITRLEDRTLELESLLDELYDITEEVRSSIRRTSK